jgi:hypothetical protein
MFLPFWRISQQKQTLRWTSHSLDFFNGFLQKANEHDIPDLRAGGKAEYWRVSKQDRNHLTAEA